MRAGLPTRGDWRLAIRFGARKDQIVSFILAMAVVCIPQSQTRGAVLSLQILHQFMSDPKNPRASLVQGNEGDFYGTTAFGGRHGDNGTVFKITPDGTFTSLFSFNGTNGSRPLANLVQGRDGNFYGTTSQGGVNYDGSTVFGEGTVFR